MNSIFSRRSIRKYINKPVEKEKIETLVKAAMQAPSAGNQQPWEFLILQNRNSLNKLSKMSSYSKLLLNSPLAIVLFGNKNDMSHPRFWEQDMAAAAENMLIQAVELNLGAVWLGVAPNNDRMEFVRNLFILSENLLPFGVISIGYSDEPITFVDRYNKNKVHFESIEK